MQKICDYYDANIYMELEHPIFKFPYLIIELEGYRDFFNIIDEEYIDIPTINSDYAKEIPIWVREYKDDLLNIWETKSYIKIPYWERA